MYVQTESSNFIKMLPIFFVILIVIMIAVFALYFFIIKKDNTKKLVTRKIKVLEKPIQQGHIEWYVVECEDGKRLKLRSFQANDIIIAVGDEGTVSYRGQTIQSFQRNEK